MVLLLERRAVDLEAAQAELAQWEPPKAGLPDQRQLQLLVVKVQTRLRLQMAAMLNLAAAEAAVCHQSPEWPCLEDRLYLAVEVVVPAAEWLLVQRKIMAVREVIFNLIPPAVEVAGVVVPKVLTALVEILQRVVLAEAVEEANFPVPLLMTAEQVAPVEEVAAVVGRLSAVPRAKQEMVVLVVEAKFASGHSKHESQHIHSRSDGGENRRDQGSDRRHDADRSCRAAWRRHIPGGLRGAELGGLPTAVEWRWGGPLF